MPPVAAFSNGTLVVFAKAPRPGRVKTRLTPPLSPEEAAGLYACLLGDALEVSARAASQLSLEAVLALDPPEARAELAPEVPDGFRLVAQHGADLGARMHRAVAEAAAAGSRAVLLRGSDSPCLDESTLSAALEALQTWDLVLCPDKDGGYNLVGLRRPAPGLFDHPMGTPTVLGDTLRNAERLGLRARLLPEGFDVDAIDDLRWLAAARRRTDPLPCPRTLAYLDTRDLWKRARV